MLPCCCAAPIVQHGRRQPCYGVAMSRITAATLAGLLFVAAYVVAAIALPDLLPRLPWSLEALYWLVAGTAWVFPIWWLMLWAVGKR